MRQQHYPDRLSPDMTINTSDNKEKHGEKDNFPTQLYRHIKVLINKELYILQIVNITMFRTVFLYLKFVFAAVVRVEAPNTS